jgi:hypothetical protein
MTKKETHEHRSKLIHVWKLLGKVHRGEMTRQMVDNKSALRVSKELHETH